jgi:NAD(P)-dependent dehydrogenase (short-subunit alcohol dehydrogenase family)
MQSIKNLVTVITGGSSGIGRATALEFARQGGTLVLCAREREPLEEVAEECRVRGGRAIAIPADVTAEGEVQQLARLAVEEFGKIDVWINNAAVTMFGRFEDLPAADFRQVIETNLFGYIHGARAVLPIFRRQGRGTLINVSSIVGLVGQPLTSAYTTTKFAIDGLSESLRMELAGTPHIHVCEILPGSIDTPLFRHAANYSGRAIKPMEPIYPPEEVARAIAKCVEHPKPRIIVGAAPKMLAALLRIAPGAAEMLMARQVPKEHFEIRLSGDHPGNLYHSMPSMNQLNGGWKQQLAKQPNGRHQGRPALLASALILGGSLAAARYFKHRHEHLALPK